MDVATIYTSMLVFTLNLKDHICAFDHLWEINLFDGTVFSPSGDRVCCLCSSSFRWSSGSVRLVVSFSGLQPKSSLTTSAGVSFCSELSGFSGRNTGTGSCHEHTTRSLCWVLTSLVNFLQVRRRNSSFLDGQTKTSVILFFVDFERVKSENLHIPVQVERQAVAWSGCTCSWAEGRTPAQAKAKAGLLALREELSPLKWL